MRESISRYISANGNTKEKKVVTKTGDEQYPEKQKKKRVFYEEGKRVVQKEIVRAPYIISKVKSAGIKLKRKEDMNPFRDKK